MTASSTQKLFEILVTSVQKVDSQRLNLEPRGRGRGYGRGRAPSGHGSHGGHSGQGQPQHQRGPRGQPGGAGPSLQGAWVRPQQPKWPRPQMGTGSVQQASQHVIGRGETRQGTTADVGAVHSRMVTEQSDVGNEGAIARGGGSTVRGRVFNRNEILFTKPQNLETKKGTNGTRINLVANYLPLIQSGKWCLYQYRVDMNPDIDHTGKRKALLRNATRELIQGGYLFDGTVMYTPQRIQPDPVELFVQDGEENIRITIRLVGDVAWGDYHYIQIFNIIIRKCLVLMGLKLVGRNYYMPENQIVIPEHKIMLWPGYTTSMRQHERDILLNVDLQFKFMRTDNVYNLLLDCSTNNVRQEFQNKIIGSVVLTYYNNKTYKIDDVAFGTTPRDTFKMKDGTDMSYLEYYQKKYGVRITNMDQPLLISRSKPREIRAGMAETVYLIPELCQLTGLTDKQRDNFQLMKLLANHTKIGVEGRIKKLMEFSRQIHQKPEVVQEIRRWDLDIANKLIEFQGRVLPNEFILSGEGVKYKTGEDADWTRTLRSKPMFFAPKMERLAVVVPPRLKNSTQEFIKTLAKTAQGMMWSIGNPKIFDIHDDRSGTYLEAIERIINTACPTLILVILPNNSQDRYSAIKKKCYVDRGVPCQIIVGRTLTSRGVMSIATKVSIQMNCKIGGAPWSVMVPLSNLMVVGYDVCRDTANKKKSFAGMVATLDKQMTRYYNCTSEHQMEEELSNNFASFLIVACKKFKQQNSVYPERIIIYRDGVGEGQLPYVYHHEVESIKKRLITEIYGGVESALKWSFIVVTKRISTRIMTSTTNPPPGTVVDDVITLPNRYDFYIIAQCVQQGTVTPTNYNILVETLGLNAEKIQVLTYKLTHMYYNWSGTVRVPAPCQYAHKLAFMASQNLHRPAHPDLESLLYYL